MAAIDLESKRFLKQFIQEIEDRPVLLGEEESYRFDLVKYDKNNWFRTIESKIIRDPRLIFDPYKTGKISNLNYIPGESQVIYKPSSSSFYNTPSYSVVPEIAKSNWSADPNKNNYWQSSWSIPEALQGHYSYILNADSLNRYTGEREYLGDNCKVQKMLNEHTDLYYIARDGVLTIPYDKLREAFLGYVWLWQQHTKDIAGARNKEYDWELKVMFDLSKGIFTPYEVPEKVFDLPKRQQ